MSDPIEFIDHCPACGGKAGTIVTIEDISTSYRWCCDTEGCKCEYDVQLDNAGKLLGRPTLDWVPGLMDGEDPQFE